MVRWFAAGAAFALMLGGGGALAQGADAAARAQARAIYQHVVEMDTSVEGGETPAMAAYLADQFRAAGFAAEDVHVLPLAEAAGLLVRYRGVGTPTERLDPPRVELVRLHGVVGAQQLPHHVPDEGDRQG